MAKKIGKGLTELLANIEDARIAATPTEIVDGEKIYNIDVSSVFAKP
ncbi:MAG: hypothetical protein RR374_06950 [Clostridia bacterium]